MNSNDQISIEKYRCRCQTEEFQKQAIQDAMWRCPICNLPIDILLNINNQTYLANRIQAKRLQVGNHLASLASGTIHEILEVSITKPKYIRLALKEYGILQSYENEYVTIILGIGNY